MGKTFKVLQTLSIIVAVWSCLFACIQIGTMAWQVTVVRKIKYELDNRQIPETSGIDQFRARFPGLYARYSETPERRRINVLFGIAILNMIISFGHLVLSALLIYGCVKKVRSCIWPWFLTLIPCILVSAIYAIIWWSGDVFREQFTMSIAEFLMAMPVNSIGLMIIALYFARLSGLGQSSQSVIRFANPLEKKINPSFSKSAQKYALGSEGTKIPIQDRQQHPQVLQGQRQPQQQLPVHSTAKGSVRLPPPQQQWRGQQQQHQQQRPQLQRQQQQNQRQRMQHSQPKQLQQQQQQDQQQNYLMQQQQSQQMRPQQQVHQQSQWHHQPQQSLQQSQHQLQRPELRHQPHQQPQHQQQLQQQRQHVQQTQQFGQQRQLVQHQHEQQSQRVEQREMNRKRPQERIEQDIYPRATSTPVYAQPQPVLTIEKQSLV